MYTVIGYDKDNDAYIEYGKYYRMNNAFNKAAELASQIKLGKLRREDNKEPIDWIEVYLDWGGKDERKIAVF